MQPQPDTTIIALSKRKIFLITAGSLAFVAGAYWLFTIAPIQTRYHEDVVRLTAIAGIAFFSLTGLYGLVKLFDRKPGLILDREGIADHSSALGGQLIRWENVKGLEMIHIHRTKILLIHVHNSEAILAAAGAWQRFLMQQNMKWYGTPACLAASSLQCDADELKAIIEKRLAAFQRDALFQPGHA